MMMMMAVIIKRLIQRPNKQLLIREKSEENTKNDDRDDDYDGDSDGDGDGDDGDDYDDGRNSTNTSYATYTRSESGD